MMSHDFYKLFILIQRVFSKMKFIISVDFLQLPPIENNWSGDYKNSPTLHELCDGNRIQLTISKRSDDVLFNLCQNVNDIVKNDFKIKESTYKNISYTHKTRMRINQECMHRFHTQYNYDCKHIKKDDKNIKSHDIILSQNMPILCKKTNKKLHILNSEIFKVHKITSTHFTIINGAKEKIDIDIKDFDQYFYIGFCITVHASQGETYTDKYTIYDWDFEHFGIQAKYVAMSRSNNINKIQIA